MRRDGQNNGGGPLASDAERPDHGATPGARAGSVPAHHVQEAARRLGAFMTPECGWPEQFRRLRRKAMWTAVILLLLSVPLVIFALVGLPHVFRNPLVRDVLSDDGMADVPAVSDERFVSGLALLTATHLVPGNRIDVLVNGDGTFPRLWADLRAARRSITVQMYYAAAGVVADSTVRILAERARAGVEVYFIYDAFGAQNLPGYYIDTLRAAGARTAQFRPVRWFALDRANHRSHVRGIVIDGSVGYTGGFGFDDKWLGQARQPAEWRETNARVSGPAVLQLQEVFAAAWAETRGELLTGRALQPFERERTSAPRPDLPGASTAAVPGDTAALLYSPSLTGSTTAERLLALSIAGARRTLYITNAYVVPHADFVRLLVDAARRGVDVRILTNGERTDVRTTWLAGRSRYETLLAGGVRIYEYKPTTLHAKTLVIDGVLSVIGTMNFDNRSLAYNDEVALIARDARLGATMDSLFHDDLRFADEIRLDAFRRRPWTARLLERGASIVAGLL